jgi:hypothetical protein
MSDPARAAKPAAPALESHYSVAQIAERWNLHSDTVRNLFFDEPGVLKIGEASRLLGGRAKKLKRHYFVLRIPESVLMRVQDRLMQKRPAESAVARRLFQSARSSDLHAS